MLCFDTNNEILENCAIINRFSDDEFRYNSKVKYYEYNSILSNRTDVIMSFATVSRNI